MISRSFWMAFAIGLAVIAWVAVGFAGHHWIAFGMTLLIAAAYLLGAHELRQYRADSALLAQALQMQTAPASLDDWLHSVPAALRGAVRQRVEESRGGLPAPALTPYLVGLLVMLGMLGTFLGMVITFKGAVFALEGSTDLQAIRAALAEPIRGLGLSFGTSVAGVAGSAMLGLMSALSRRERAALARVLDGRAATLLRAFTAAHQREQALAAAQAHVAGLPGVVERLDALMQRIEQRGQEIDERLARSQAQFQQEVSASYGALSRDVAATLKESLAAGAQAAGDSIRPVMESAMVRIAQEQAAIGERQAAHDTQRLDQWARRLETLGADLDARWQALAQRGEERNTLVLERVSALIGQTEALVAARAESESQWLAQHGQRMEALATAWQAHLASLREEESRHAHTALERIGELTRTWGEQLATLRGDEQQRGTAAAQRLDELNRQWHERMELLRADEQQRGEAAVQRLGELQAAVAQHLASLGSALEAPLSRLLATASEVPQAAAGVLAQLRQEMAHLAEQENAALRERTVLVERLGELVGTVEQSSRQAGEMAAQAGASAVELSAWGEAFGQGVQRFQASNDRLVAAMQQVEAAVSRSTARSDEQLAYYVNQAREVIDLSIASQHGVIERLREIAARPGGVKA